MLSKVFTLNPLRHSVRFHSTTPFLNTFMSSNEKGPLQLVIESKVKTVISYTLYVTYDVFFFNCYSLQKL